MGEKRKVVVTRERRIIERAELETDLTDKDAVYDLACDDGLFQEVKGETLEWEIET